MALHKELLRQHYLDQFFGSPAFRAELSAFVVPADGRLAPHLEVRLGRSPRRVKRGMAKKRVALGSIRPHFRVPVGFFRLNGKSGVNSVATNGQFPLSLQTQLAARRVNVPALLATQCCNHIQPLQC